MLSDFDLVMGGARGPMSCDEALVEVCGGWRGKVYFTERAAGAGADAYSVVHSPMLTQK